MKVRISDKVFEIAPELKEYIIVARNVNVQTSRSREIVEGLEKAQRKIRDTFTIEELQNHPHFKPYDQFYDKISESTGDKSISTKKVRSSHIALAKRVLEGGKIPNINPIVNMYNSVSLEYLIPIGAEDLDMYQGDLVLDVATGDEQFRQIMALKDEKVVEGEVVWKDELGVTCRMLSWRQSERSKVTKESQNIIFIIDSLLPNQDSALYPDSQSAESIAKLLSQYFNVETETYVLTKDNPVVEFDFQKNENRNKEDQDKKENLEEKKAKAKESGEVHGRKGITKRKAESLGLKSDSTLLSKIEGLIIKQADVRQDSLGLNYTPDDQYGEVSSNISFRLAGELKKSPRDIASDLSEKIMSSNIKVSSNDGSGTKFVKEAEYPTEESKVRATAEGSREDINSLEVPDELTIELVDGVKPTENGYVNISLSDQYLLSEMADVLNERQLFGSFDLGEDRKILVESPSWNPNKTAHVGHMLNLFLGKSLMRLFDKVGLETADDNIANDKGLPVMQTVWAYMKYGDNNTPDSAGDKADHFVHRFYTLGKKKYSESEDVKEDVKEVLRKWESGDEEVRDVWKKIVNWAYKGQSETVARVWENVGWVWYESEVYQGGKDIVTEAEGKGIVEKLPDGALIARIEQEYGLPDTIVLKSDGTGLYHTQDIFLTIKKRERFDPWKMVWVVGEEQIAHFQRLFSILDAMEIMPIKDLYHYAYSMVVAKDGKKLSSRDGQDLSADELLDTMRDAGKKVLTDRVTDISEQRDDKGDDDQELSVKEELSDKEMDNIAEIVAIGALKYALLSRDPFKQIRFDAERALSFQGKSGPYIMYSYTRAFNILKKIVGDVGEESTEIGEKAGYDKDDEAMGDSYMADSGSLGDEKYPSDLIAEEEKMFKKLKFSYKEILGHKKPIRNETRKLIVQMLKYPEVVLSSANNYSPGILAEYLFELAKCFNNFYENVPIIGSDEDELKLRASVLYLYMHVVRDGLQILGIRVLAKM